MRSARLANHARLRAELMRKGWRFESSYDVDAEHFRLTAHHPSDKHQDCILVRADELDCEAHLLQYAACTQAADEQNEQKRTGT